MPLLPHRVLRSLLRLLFYTFGRIELIGVENIPLKGGVLVAVNHLSRLDGPLMLATLPRADITALAAEEYRQNAVSRWFLDSARAIWLDRDNPDAKTLKTAIQFLRNGGMLGIAPEGTRSRTGALIAAKPGVAYLATKADVPLLPVAVYGTEDALRQVFRFRRPHVRLVYGETFRLPSLDRAHRDETLQRNADEIMCRIAVLLPKAYRGVYADHPRLHELEAVRH